MRVKLKLYLSAILGMALLLFFSGFLYFFSYLTNEEIKKVQLAEEFTRASSGLSILVHSLEINVNFRNEKRLERKLIQISKLIDASKSRIYMRGIPNSLKSLNSAFKNLQEIATEVDDKLTIREIQKEHDRQAFMKRRLSAVMYSEAQKILDVALIINSEALSNMARLNDQKSIVTIIFSLLLLLSIGGTALCVAGNISQPLEKLLLGVEALKFGNLDYRISDERTDEFGTLIQSFNDMALRLGLQNEKIDSNRERLLSILDNSPSPITITGLTDSLIKYANPAAEDLFGVTAGELVGSNAMEMYVNQADQILMLDSLKKDGEIKNHELLVKKADGAQILVNLNGRLSEFDNEHVMIAGLNDITERKRIESQLLQSTKLATLGEMASGIAHELNQPLSVISMASESAMLEVDEGKVDAEFLKSKLQNIYTQTDRMATTIDHMRLFSRKDAVAMEPFDPSEAVTGALSLVSEQFRAAGIDLIIGLSDGLRLVEGHRMQLEQVIINLFNNARDAVLENAAKAGPPENYTPTVKVSVVDTMSASWITLSVSDNGGGIDDSALADIFDPYFTTKKEGVGTGLGLSISYSIISAMGGHLTVSNTDEGAEFLITLPVADKQSKPEALSAKENAKRQKPREDAQAPFLPSILLVDDEKDILDVEAEYLRGKGYEVATASDGIEALAIQRSEPADIVVTDLNMPKMDGHELLRELRKINAEQLVIVVTGYTSFGEDENIKADGASIVLKKPLSLRELRNSVQTLYMLER